MTEKLRYTGVQATVFQHDGVGLVSPDDPEFEVPEEVAERYLRRPDVERASEDARRDQDGDTSGGTASGKRGRSGSPTGKNGAGEQ